MTLFMWNVYTTISYYFIVYYMLRINRNHIHALSIRYSTIETKEAARIGYNITGFFFSMSTQVKAGVRSTKAVTWERMRKMKLVISNSGTFFCFNNNVSNLYKGRNI
jgi:hypothetical protein